MAVNESELVMVIDASISLGNLITLLVIFVGAVSGYVTMRMTVKANNAAINGLAETISHLSDAHDATSRRVEEVRSKSAHELAELRLDVAKNYGTISQIQAVEKRILEGVSRLEGRFDRFGEQLSKMHQD